MALPSVDADKISSAMAQFDDELRTNPQWVNWQDNQSYRYAINKDGKLYPVKQIVSMATGASVNSFSGGSEANNFVKERGFEVEPLQLPTESETRIALHELLLQGAPNPVTPQVAYRALAEHFRLSTRLRTQVMQNQESSLGEPCSLRTAQVSRCRHTRWLRARRLEATGSERSSHLGREGTR